jgi:prepilin-type N-terminal cleavage/methylation domain-containing protein
MEALRRRLRSESGFTLPELLIALMIGLLIAAGAATMLMVAVKAQPRTSERAAQIQQGRVMLENLTRELRQGETVSNASPSGLQILTYVHTSGCGSGTPGGDARMCLVTYACSDDSCVRTERDPGGGGSAPARTVVTGIADPAVFSYEGGSDTTYVGVRLVFPQADGEEAVTLSDGAALRNYFDSTGDA